MRANSLAVNWVLGSEMTVVGAVLIAGSWLVAAGSLTVSDLLPFLVVGIGPPTSIRPMISGSIGVRSARMAAAHIEGLLATWGNSVPPPPIASL